MKLGKKLIEIRKELPYLKKGTKSYQYKYVKGSEILYKIQDKMNELGVLLYPKMGPIKIKTENFYRRMWDKNGNEYEKFVAERFVKSDGWYVWMDAETGETIEVDWSFVGEMDDLSKGFGSALTYSERYFLMKFFNIPTDEDDPDAFAKKNDTSPPKPKETPKPKNPMTKAQKDKLEAIAKKLPVDQAGKLNKWLKGDRTSFDSALQSIEHYEDVLAKMPKVEEQVEQPKEEKLPF